jgi:acetyltransferase-like isoleucine patch superfamily enzyme/acyl carrier protein
LTANSSLAHRLASGASEALRHGLSPLFLRSVTRLGQRAQVRGAPLVDNRGSITIGDDFRLSSVPERSHLVTGGAGSIAIGSRVTVGAGSGIASLARITIGDGVQIGSRVMVWDADYRSADDSATASEAAAVVIEDDVRIDANVTVLKGSFLGKGAWVAAGSVVSGMVPPGAFVRGAPAEVVTRAGQRRETSAPGPEQVLERLKHAVSQTFGLASPPEPGDGPATIRAWDSLGTLRLLLAIEEEFHIVLAENALAGIGSLSNLQSIILQNLGSRARRD